MIDRRTFLIGAPFLIGGPLLAGACATAARSPVNDMEEQFHRLCAGLGPGNRLGVAVIDAGSGRRWGYQADSRFAMCSTFKLPLAAMILAEAQAGRLSLADQLPFARGDLVSHSPVLEANLARGRLSFERLAQAIVEVSDNGAANLLLRRVGGPQALTGFFRANGDAVTRLDRYELELNENRLGDARDTTTPAAMAGLVLNLLTGNRLPASGRALLFGWMRNASTGLDRLRAGFPAGWAAGDKTGTGNGANNDVAVAYPPNRAPLVVASYIDARGLENPRKNATHAAVARIVAASLG